MLPPNHYLLLLFNYLFEWEIFNTHNFSPADNLRTGRKEENRGNVVVYKGEEKAESGKSKGGISKKDQMKDAG